MARAKAKPRATTDALGTGTSLVPDEATRAAVTARLAATTSRMTTAALQAMEDRLPWFGELNAEERAWITLVARGGIDQFVQWFAALGDHEFNPTAVFDAAPRAMTRHVSLHQTVDLVRIMITVVEEQIQLLLPEGDRQVLTTAIIHFSREVAFGAAEVYARAAEVRGSWDARLEALVVDAVVRAEADETVISRASTLGWISGARVAVVAGPAPSDPSMTVEEVRRHAHKDSLRTLAALQGDRLVVIVSGDSIVDNESALAAVETLAPHFGEGPIVIGPVVEGLADAAASARAATIGAKAALAWPEGDRILSADELLPERALIGDGHARRSLAHDIYAPLAAAGGDLLLTCVSFLDHGCSVEASARGLFVHPNTVRYRIKRIQDVTGYSPMDPREAYVLRLAITLGRLNVR